MCGTYVQFFWSSTTFGEAGKPVICLCGPFKAQMKQFGSPPSSATTNFSIRSGFALWTSVQKASEPGEIAGTSGFAPVHLTVPETEAVDFPASYAVAPAGGGDLSAPLEAGGLLPSPAGAFLPSPQPAAATSAAVRQRPISFAFISLPPGGWDGISGGARRAGGHAPAGRDEPSMIGQGGAAVQELHREPGSFRAGPDGLDRSSRRRPDVLPRGGVRTRDHSEELEIVLRADEAQRPGCVRRVVGVRVEDGERRAGGDALALGRAALEDAPG